MLSRRTFGALCVSAAASACCTRPAAAPDPQVRSLDLHTHLFGDGSGGSGMRISAAVRQSPTFETLIRALGIAGEPDLDAAYLRCLVEQAKWSGLDRVVLLGQDGVYKEDGTPDDLLTSFLTPNDDVFAACAAHPDLLVPCPSINPDRRDAIAELDSCVARGARVLKIHPPIQRVDVSDPRHRPFFRACARHDILVMVHTGHEHSAPIFDIDLANPRRLEQALAAGCRVVACHAGSGRTTDEPDFVPDFVEMTRRHEKLFGDTSILCTPGRERDLLRLLAVPHVRERLVHGSDFPFPSVPAGFADQIGQHRANELTSDRNFLRRDLQLKRALGLDRSVTRAAQLLFG
jgi:predicted TIM-barrel fold metal-dependent hydrolase